MCIRIKRGRFSSPHEKGEQGYRPEKLAKILGDSLEAFEQIFEFLEYSLKKKFDSHSKIACATMYGNEKMKYRSFINQLHCKNSIGMAIRT